MKRHLIHLWLIMAVAALGLPCAAHAFSSGITGCSGNPATLCFGTQGGTCTVCHSGGITPTVTLTGPTTVAPGSISTYILTISGGQEVAGGFDISTTAGMLMAIEAGTQLSNGEMTHTTPRAASGGNVTFSFDLTAPPTAGTLTLYGAGNSVNGMNGNQGDMSATATLQVVVEGVVEPQPPVSDPNGPYSGTVGAMIAFDGSGSSDADGTIVSYDWDFGDGATGTGVNPSHSYTAAGTYTVSLTVTDDSGATDTASTTVTISEGPQPPQPMTSLEKLGKALFFDTNLSTPKGQACAVCHTPEAGWTGPDGNINAHGAVYEGAKHKLFGNRKPPSSAYATPSPVFHMDGGGFIGGNFWDGRATGEKLGNPAADQALGPFLNPVEQANPSEKVVCDRVRQSTFAKELTGQSYEELFTQAFGPGSLDCMQKNVLKTYDRFGLAIAAYEASREVNQFSSKFDAFLAGHTTLTAQENLGFELFTGKARCSSCHLVTPGPNGEPPLFTDFRFHNLGVPKNPENPFYSQHEKINPAGAAWIDPGLGGFLTSRPDYRAFAAENFGKHKTPTLRNVDKRPTPDFVKAFMHNGTLKSLEAVVHFYNTRDVPGMWPPPEVGANLSPLLGDLGLTPEEEAALVAFMKTLSDGFSAP